jgi:ribosomal protein L37AE/L43A
MKTKNAQVRCPYCGKTNTVPETASISVTCSQCGKNLYTEGIEVMDKASSKVYDDFDRQRKEEIETDKEKD